jgi:PAS domain S-box-containing protein
LIPSFKKRQRLDRSLALSTALLVIVVIGATMLVVQSSVKAILTRGLEERGLAISESIGAIAKPSLLAYNYAALQVAAEGAIEFPALVYIVIHDKEGGIAGIAGTVPAAEGFPGLPESLMAPMSRDVFLRDEAGEKRWVLETALPVFVERVPAPWGYVRVGLAYDSLTAALQRLKIGLALSGLILALVAVISSRWMAQKITAPLRRLAEGTEALSKGDTSHRIPVRGTMELAELAQAFNRMIDRLRAKAEESEAYQNQLAALNATLEEQVLERTRALEESEAQYRILVEHSPDSILIVQHGKVLFVNRVFEETFCITVQQALDTAFKLECIFEESHVETVRERIMAWERGEALGPVQVMAMDAAGILRELELRGSRIDYMGESAVECLLVDTTEAKRLREKLEDNERLRALGELASGVAHDFNNLLGAILGRTQLLRGRDFDTEVDRELAVIEKAARDGRETVRRIQEFSRLRTDHPQTPVSLAEILADAVEITRTRWKAEAERRNVKIEVLLDCGQVLPILGNATELREVFTNLILNAVDAMPQGGDVKIHCFQDGPKARVEVQDSGVGMTEEIRRHLFDPFFTTKGQSGTGLGMSVAYGIVTRHNGTIEVSSAMGMGTKFTLEFPSCDPKELAEIPDEEAVPLAALTGRILVIDDEQPIAQLLEDALTGEGHSVEIATTAGEGLKMAELSKYDLVLTDLGMPDMSGWEVTATLRERLPEMPVILVTGWGTALDAEEVENAGVAAVIHKPFEIQELLQTTNNVLQRAAMSGSGQGDSESSTLAIIS